MPSDPEDGLTFRFHPARESSLGVPELHLRCNPVADQLLQFLDLREPAPFAPGPDRLAINANLENTAASREQRDLSDNSVNRGEEFLSHPSAAQEPSALGAILNFDSGSCCHFSIYSARFST